WPDYDPEAVIEETVTVIIQVNGKIRGKLENYPTDTPEPTVVKASGSNSSVKPYLNGREYRYVYIPNRLINFIVGEKLPPDSSIGKKEE
ncbi:hypothetical protein KAX21_02450, partial [candidate division WOR-3 bacterium]|nr:hypothetical protein [candidate division WOR-3 bacterium]